MFNPTIEKLKAFFFANASFHLFMGMLGAAIFMLVMHLFESRPIPIATIDITGIVNQFVQGQTKLHLSKEELQKRVHAFSQQLEVILNAESKQRQAVLLPAEAVIAGSFDLTPEVQKQLQNTKQ